MKADNKRILELESQVQDLEIENRQLKRREANMKEQLTKALEEYSELRRKNAE